MAGDQAQLNADAAAQLRAGAAEFLARAGWAGADAVALPHDASFRRYFRLHNGAQTALLMDAPPAQEDAGAFQRMADWLVGCGFSAPRVLAADLGRGFLLIEDFGSRVVGAELRQRPELEPQVYGDAVQLLAALGRQAPPAWLPPYDRAVMQREVRLFPEWFGRGTGVQFDVAGFDAAWDAVWGAVLQQRQARPVVTLRDYHVDNLMLLPRAGLAGLGLLDFQDALAGHPAYDLVSLLQDARRDVAPAAEERLLADYLAVAGVADAPAFRGAYEVLGAQRNVKILGIFVRLKLRDGRQGYVERLPRVWGYLDRNLAHPALRPLRRWFAANVGADLRQANFAA